MKPIFYIPLNIFFSLIMVLIIFLLIFWVNEYFKKNIWKKYPQTSLFINSVTISVVLAMILIFIMNNVQSLKVREDVEPYDIEEVLYFSSDNNASALTNDGIKDIDLNNEASFKNVRKAMENPNEYTIITYTKQIGFFHYKELVIEERKE